MLSKTKQKLLKSCFNMKRVFILYKNQMYFLVYVVIPLEPNKVSENDAKWMKINMLVCSHAYISLLAGLNSDARGSRTLIH